MFSIWCQFGLDPMDYFKATNFRGILLAWLSQNNTFHCLTNFSFVVVLKIEFFMCASFQDFRNLGKSLDPKCKHKYIFIVFYTPLIHSQKYRHLQLDLQILRVEDLPPVWQEPLFNKIVIDDNKITKSNDFRRLCYNVCGKEVTRLCFLKFVALVLFQSWKNVSIVSSNNENEVLAKKDLDRVKRVFPCTNGHK